MHIYVTKIVSPDLFVDNESVVFDRRQSPEYASGKLSLAAVTFTARKPDVSCNLSELAEACGNEACALITKMTRPCPNFWLFAAEKFEVPASQNARTRERRIAEYRKAWSQSIYRIANAPINNTAGEVVIDSGPFVYVAGLLEVSHLKIEAIDAVRTHPAYSMFVSKRHHLDSPESVRSIFSSSFPQEKDAERLSVNWLSLAAALCMCGDMLLRVSGLFDDGQAAVDIIGDVNTIFNFDTL